MTLVFCLIQMMLFTFPLPNFIIKLIACLHSSATYSGCLRYLGASWFFFVFWVPWRFLSTHWCHALITIESLGRCYASTWWKLLLSDMNSYGINLDPMVLEIWHWWPNQILKSLGRLPCLIVGLWMVRDTNG